MNKINILSSSKQGFNHWFWQRFTAIILIFLVSAFIYYIYKIIIDIELLNIIFINKFSKILTILIFSFAIFHGSLGFKTVIEDYIKCKCLKYFLIIFNNFIMIFAIIALFIALI